jgi:hypothetical protein
MRSRVSRARAYVDAANETAGASNKTMTIENCFLKLLIKKPLTAARTGIVVAKNLARVNRAPADR